MRYIDLDGTGWKVVLDFCHDLLAALGAPKWHGESIASLVDSMVWGGINTVEPPYVVRIRGMSGLPDAVRQWIELLDKVIVKQRADYRRQNGKDVDVSFELLP